MANLLPEEAGMVRKRFGSLVIVTLMIVVGGSLLACGHGGAVVAPPLPSSEEASTEQPKAVPTTLPAGPTPMGSTREPVGQTPQVEPPPAVLEIAGEEQVGGIGSYCWSKPTGEDTSVAVCADMAGIATAEKPLLASSPFTATFRLAPEEAPDELLLQVIGVAAGDELERWPAGSRGWAYRAGERYTLPLERAPSAELALGPGLYVLNLTGRWATWGDAEYGFLVEVQAPVSALEVDESPIVAAEVDGPGHLEYRERLGEEILARIERLRADAAAQEVARNNEALSPFGLRLEARFNAKWNRTFYDLVRQGQAKPVLAGLSRVWPASVNASGTDFLLVAENAPNSQPFYVQVQASGVGPWDADPSAYLAPGYAGDSLARVTFTGFPTMTYQVELDGQGVYSGTAVAQGAYMPLRGFTTWDGHWALEVDDYVIVDGEDLGEASGYEAVFGFHLIQGRLFYFFERGGEVRISYDGQVLPNVYDEVFHNRCCEAAVHNVETLGDVVVFHALRDGTWYLVEAGVYDGEMAGD
jgi:hypothetical protein